MISVRNTSVPRVKPDLASLKPKVNPDSKAEKPKEPTVPVDPSDAVDIDEDGAGAGGGYKTVSPADDDGAGAGGGYKTVNPADDDGAGAGGGYKTVGVAPQNFETVSSSRFWNEPLTMVSLNNLGSQTLTSTFGGDFYSEWLQASEKLSTSSKSTGVSLPAEQALKSKGVAKNVNPSQGEGPKS